MWVGHSLAPQNHYHLRTTVGSHLPRPWFSCPSGLQGHSEHTDTRPTGARADIEQDFAFGKYTSLPSIALRSTSVSPPSRKPFKPPISSSLLLGTQSDACVYISLQDSEGGRTGRIFPFRQHSASKGASATAPGGHRWRKANPGQMTGFSAGGHPDSLFPEYRNK